MAVDLTSFRADTDALLTLWGETVAIHRLTLNHATIPPTETWATSGDVAMEIQPTAGMKIRHDAGVVAQSTHWGFAKYNSGIVVGDRIIRFGDSNYYEVLRVDDFEDHLEIWMRYVKGVV